MDKFYNRHISLKLLTDTTNNLSVTHGRLTVLVGRRRVGKTKLIKEVMKRFVQSDTASASDSAYAQQAIPLYLFISRKSEMALVTEFQTVIANALNIKFFQPNSLKQIFEFLFEYGKAVPLLIAIDEFQDIELVNPALFSDLQNLWDSYKQETKTHLICCGSLYSMMVKLFKDQKQPLFNRYDSFLPIEPLTPSYIYKIIQDQKAYTPENVLLWWSLSGGLPKYLEWLCNYKQDPIAGLICSGSPLIQEGEHRLVEDFGKQHRLYFDILQAISIGHTSRARIEDYLDTGVGPALEQLEEEFDIIAKQRPITSKSTSRDIRYQIKDPFLRFWFRFIYTHRSAVEIGNYDYIKAIITRDYETFSGKALESLFEAILIESKQFNRIGGYWDKKGENEIDIIAINDLEKRIEIIEVKRNSKKFNENKLIQKSVQLFTKLSIDDYKVTYRCFSLDNLHTVLEEFSRPSNPDF